MTDSTHANILHAYLKPEMGVEEFCNEAMLCLSVNTQGTNGAGIDDYSIDDTIFMWE